MDFGTARIASMYLISCALPVQRPLRLAKVVQQLDELLRLFRVHCIQSNRPRG